MIDDEKRFALEKSVARYLFIASKDVPHGEAKIFRAAALLLLGKPIAPALMNTAEHALLDDDPLYSRVIYDAEDLLELWSARLS